MVFKKNSFLKKSILLFSLSSALIFAEAKPVKEVAVVMVAGKIAQENPPLLGPIVLGLGCILGLGAFIQKIYKYECNRNEEAEEFKNGIQKIREGQKSFEKEHKLLTESQKSFEEEYKLLKEGQKSFEEEYKLLTESQKELSENQKKTASLIQKLEEFLKARRGENSALNEPTS